MNASDTTPRRWLWTGLILTALFVLVPLLLSLAGRSYFYQIANTIMIFALLAASMHLVTGVAGLLQLGHAAFYGIGGYGAAFAANLAFRFLHGRGHPVVIARVQRASCRRLALGGGSS